MKLWQSQQGGSGSGSSGDVYWSAILGKPLTFTPSSHQHTLSNITDLSSLTLDYSQLTSVPLSFTPSTHIHAISDITNLQTTLDGKASSVHSHTLSNITDLIDLTLDYAKLTNVPSSFNPATHNHDSDYLKLSGGTISGSIIPQTHNTIDLGSDLVRFKDIWTEELHLSGNSLYLGDTKVLGTDASTVIIKTDPGQHLKLQTTTALLSLLTLGTNANINLTAGGTGSRIQISSTDSEVNIAAVQTTVTGDITAENNLSVIGNLTITGDLTVNGNNFTANAQTVNIEDNIVIINHGEVGSGVTNRYAGVQVDRGSLADFQFVYDEFDDFFKMGEIGDLEIVASRDWCSSQFSALNHSHNISDITNLQTTLDGKASTTHNHDSAYRQISYVPSWTEITDKPATFTPSTHSHSISDITNLQTTLDGKSATSHNHDSTYLALTGGSLSGSLTFTSPKLKYGNSLLVSGLVIDSTKWYRVLSVDGNYEPWIELLIQIPLGHSVYRVRLAKGTGGNGMGWTAEVDCGGIYNYFTGNIIAVRVVDGGPNAATYVDVKFNGNATRDIKLAIVSELANHVGNYATLVACLDQGTATAGVVSNLGFYDHATTIGVSKSYLSPWGVLSLQNDSASLRHRYVVGTCDFTMGINSVGGSIQTRSSHPLNLYTNTIKRLEISNSNTTTLTIYGSDISGNTSASLVFQKVGIASVYSQSIKFSYSSIRHYVTDAMIPNYINNGLEIGYDDGSSISSALVIGNGQVAINGGDIASDVTFQVNGLTNVAATLRITTASPTISFIDTDSRSAHIHCNGNVLYFLRGNTTAGTSWSQVNGAWPMVINLETNDISVGGDLGFYGTAPGAINFGSVSRQMLNLWSTSFGIGIQNNTLYFRTYASGRFSFHRGGIHIDAIGDPGEGGVCIADLNSNGFYLNEGWFRTTGQAGWYSTTYGGGIYMTDTTWVRAYNGKGLNGYWLNGSTLAGTGNRAVYSDAVGTLTNTASDESLKENIAPLTYGLNEVLALAPVFYNWKDTERMGSQKEIGLIAQQVQTVIPEVIGENFDGTLSLDYPKLVAVLINAIKELADK